MEVYFVEAGTLLGKEDKEYAQYSSVYDRNHGFFDEWQKYMPCLDGAVKEAESYVRAGGENSYAVISVFEVPYDYTETELDSLDLPGTGYLMEDVVFSLAKENGSLVYGFLCQA